MDHLDTCKPLVMCEFSKLAKTNGYSAGRRRHIHTKAIEAPEIGD